MSSSGKAKRAYFFIQSHKGGFSLIEFLTVTVIMGLIFIVAVPSFREMELSMDRGRSIRQIEADIRKVQGIALSRGLRATMLFNDTGSSYQIWADYAPYSETGRPNEAEGDEKLSESEFPSSVSIMVMGRPVIFNSRGYLINPDGNYTSIGVHLRQEGRMFLSGFIPPNGFVYFNPREGAP